MELTEEMKGDSKNDERRGRGNRKTSEDGGGKDKTGMKREDGG